MKNELELFDESRMIHQGKHFDEVLTDESQITVLQGEGTRQIELIRSDDIIQLIITRSFRSFDACEFPEPIIRNIMLKQYKEPTQIQALLSKVWNSMITFRKQLFR